MAYSNRKIPDDPSLFPSPQTWLTWVEERRHAYDQAKQEYVLLPAEGEGKLRHYDSLPAARKALGWVGSQRGTWDPNTKKVIKPKGPAVFRYAWRVYEWDGEAWVVRYSGEVNELRNENPLFKLRFKANEKVHRLDTKLEEKAIESIRQAVG